MLTQHQIPFAIRSMRDSDPELKNKTGDSTQRRPVQSTPSQCLVLPFLFLCYLRELVLHNSLRFILTAPSAVGDLQKFSRKIFAPKRAGGLSPGFNAFVPEGQADRSQARSAWVWSIYFMINIEKVVLTENNACFCSYCFLLGRLLESPRG